MALVEVFIGGYWILWIHLVTVV